MPRVKRVNKLYTLDTETIGLGGALKRIALYDGKEVTYGYKFADVEPVLIEAWKAGTHPRVYIHNLEFDARKLDGLFRPGNINWDTSALINNRYARINCKNYTLHCSFKLLPMALAKASKDFDLEHGKLDLWEEVQATYPGEYTDHVDFLNRCDPDDLLYIKYLGYDVISLYELIEKLMEVSGLTLDEIVGRMSTASLSKYIFRKGFMGVPFQEPDTLKTDYQIVTDCKQWGSTEPRDAFEGKSFAYLEELIREGYYGGRTEVFTPRLKQKEGFHLDVNSLYPAAMEDNPFPIGTPQYVAGNDSCTGYWDMWRTSGTGLGYVKAKVFIPMQHIPPLPVKMGKLVFPCGEVEGCWTFTELAYAIDHCGVIVREMSEMVYFKKTAKVFKNFVGRLYPIKVSGKKDGNAALAALAKLLLNTGYGYLCLNRDKSDVKNYNPKNMEKYADRINFVNEDLGYIDIQSPVQSDSVQVAIGAYVTSYARLILLDMLRYMDERTDVYYCDTDSIVCGELPPAEKIHPTALGLWDLEATIDDGIFLMPKVYWEHKKESGKETVKFKGVSRETQKTFDKTFYTDLLKKLKRGNKDRITVEKNKELLRSIAYTQKKGIDPNTIEHRDKKINLGNVQKRDVDYKNNFSMPWYFDTLEEFKAFNFDEPILKWSEYGNRFAPYSQPPRR